MPVCMGMAVVCEKYRSVCAWEYGRMDGKCLLCMGMTVVCESVRNVGSECALRV